MNTFKILVQGYALSGENDTYVASPTCTLIESNDKKILVDPGANQSKVLDALKKAHISPKEIDSIFLSHYHPDHFLALRAFPKHTVIDGEMIWKEDVEIEHGSSVIPDTEIKILKTPGHSPEHTSLLIKTKEKGNVCIAQDVFWWENGSQKSDSIEDLMNLKDPFASDERALRKSRKKVLAVADWIIPGHGKMFINPKNR